MPALIGFLILLGAMYHLFFRFDRWHNDNKPGVVYEHDNLTGDTRVIQADGFSAKARVSARILGEEGGASTDLNGPRDGLNGYEGNRIELQSQPQDQAQTQAQGQAQEPLQGQAPEQSRSRESAWNPWGETVTEVAPEEPRRASERRSLEPPSQVRHAHITVQAPLPTSPPVTRRRREAPPVPLVREEEPLASVHVDKPALRSWDWRDDRQVEKVARPIPVPRVVMMASVAPPVPRRFRVENIADVRVAPFAVRKIDLNRDGANEEIIHSASSHEDGLLDISIVQNGREIFFGRGRQIALLPSRTRDGWADIALKANGKIIGVFRYNPREDAYTAITNDNNPV